MRLTSGRYCSWSGVSMGRRSGSRRTRRSVSAGRHRATGVVARSSSWASGSAASRIATPSGTPNSSTACCGLRRATSARPSMISSLSVFWSLGPLAAPVCILPSLSVWFQVSWPTLFVVISHNISILMVRLLALGHCDTQNSTHQSALCGHFDVIPSELSVFPSLAPRSPMEDLLQARTAAEHDAPTEPALSVNVRRFLLSHGVKEHNHASEIARIINVDRSQSYRRLKGDVAWSHTDLRAIAHHFGAPDELLLPRDDLARFAHPGSDGVPALIRVPNLPPTGLLVPGPELAPGDSSDLVAIRAGTSWEVHLNGDEPLGVRRHAIEAL